MGKCCCNGGFPLERGIVSTARGGERQNTMASKRANPQGIAKQMLPKHSEAADGQAPCKGRAKTEGGPTEPASVPTRGRAGRSGAGTRHPDFRCESGSTAAVPTSPPTLGAHVGGVRGDVEGAGRPMWSL